MTKLMPVTLRTWTMEEGSTNGPSTPSLAAWITTTRNATLWRPISVPTVLPDLQRVTDMACSLHSLQHGASARNPLWNLYAIEWIIWNYVPLGANWATRISEVPIIPLLSNSLRALYLWEVIFTRPLLLPRSPIGTLHGRLLPWLT